jgi:RNA polymerase sigma factor (TIGR02999 family)
VPQCLLIAATELGLALDLTRDYSPNMLEITRILSQIDQGDASAANALLPVVYDELRKLAAVRLTREAPDQTLQATALVHDSYLRLVDVKQAQNWNSRGHFFAAAAEAMRRILVERARYKRSFKAGGNLKQVELSEVPGRTSEPVIDLLALHEALKKLEIRDFRKAELVKLRYFAGLTNQQASEVLGISVSTGTNEWAYAKSWLRLEMTGQDESTSSG